MKTLSFAPREVKYIAGGNINHIMLRKVQNPSLKIRSRQQDSISGVKVPKFDYFMEG